MSCQTQRSTSKEKKGEFRLRQEKSGTGEEVGKGQSTLRFRRREQRKGLNRGGEGQQHGWEESGGFLEGSKGGEKTPGASRNQGK